MSLFQTVLALLAVVASGIAWSLGRRLVKLEHRHRRELEAQKVQREIELRAQAARTTALFDRMVEGIIVVGADGLIRLANHAAGNFFGFAPPATGRTVMEATRQHDVAALMARLDRESEVLNHEIRLEAVSATRHLHVNAMGLRGPNGRDGAILVFHDLTRIRQLEAVRQDFVANVSHELRTPLSSIKSAAETLIDGGRTNPEVTMRFLEIIDRNASRLSFLIDDLLLLSRFDSGHVDLTLRPVALSALVDDAVSDAALLAEGKGVRLVNEVPGDLQAEADGQRLRQVLSNLIDNAIKYGRVQGTVIVAGRRVAGGVVEMCVRDDGPGIPPEARERVFERFFRVDKARSREQGGTGLGLAIVKNVVQAHGGEVRVESKFGLGAEFYFTVPATREPAKPAAEGCPANVAVG